MYLVVHDCIANIFGNAAKFIRILGVVEEIGNLPLVYKRLQVLNSKPESVLLDISGSSPSACCSSPGSASWCMTATKPAATASSSSSFRLSSLLSTYTHIQITNNPADSEYGKQTGEDRQRFPELREGRVVVGDDEPAVAKLVDDVDSSERECRSADGVEESTVEGGRIGD